MYKRRRNSSFFPGEETPQNTIYYTIILCSLSVIALFIILFSASFTESSNMRMFDQRFGNCSVYKCGSTYPKLAIIIIINSADNYYFEKFRLMINRMKEKSAKTADKSKVDLFIFPFSSYYSSSKTNEQIVTKINKIAFSNDESSDLTNLADIFDKIIIENPIPNIITPDDLLIHLFANSTQYFPQHCFIQLLSLDTYFLKKNWLDAIISRSLNAFSQNFWMKGPVDMSFQPFSSYEEIEISFNSLYAIHNSCMADLIDFALELNPNVRIEKAINNLLRNPMEVRLAHWLAPRILPTSIGLNFESTKTSLKTLKNNFPDACFAYGKNIDEV